MKKNVILLIAVLIYISIFSSGCASIMCKSEKTINISSEPPGAQFTIIDKKGNAVTQGTTPSNVSLKRGAGYFSAGDYTITLEKAGYEKVNQPIKQGLEAGWYLGGNIIFGGLIGILIVDPITGAMWDIKDVNVTMETGMTNMSSMLLPDKNRNSILQANRTFSP